MARRKKILFDSASITVVLLAVVVAIALLLLAWGGAYLGALVAPDLNSSVTYVPLVRHSNTDGHCYDNGSRFCEKEREYTAAHAKEYLLGFIFSGDKLTDREAFTPLYSCADTNSDGGGKYLITADTVDNEQARRRCTDANLRPFQLGYLARREKFDAPLAVYRCETPNELDVILTLDPEECAGSQYKSPERLGYLVTGGRLPQTQLAQLCEAPDQPPVTSPVPNDPGDDTSPTPTPTPTPSPEAPTEDPVIPTPTPAAPAIPQEQRFSGICAAISLYCSAVNPEAGMCDPARNPCPQ